MKLDFPAILHPRTAAVVTDIREELSPNNSISLKYCLIALKPCSATAVGGVFRVWQSKHSTSSKDAISRSVLLTEASFWLLVNTNFRRFLSFNITSGIDLKWFLDRKRLVNFEQRDNLKTNLLPYQFTVYKFKCQNCHNRGLNHRAFCKIAVWIIGHSVKLGWIGYFG